MNVLVLNGSPKMDKGNTALILKPFLEGVTQAGARVEVLYTKRLRIKPCNGEYNCWLKTPGTCYQKDDMQLVLPKVRAADVLVLAAPVYVDGMPGPLKNVLDRMLPLVQPFFELHDGHCRHPWRGEQRQRKIVLVSNCGFWERDNFDPLLAHVGAVCKKIDATFAGALLRPHGPAFQAMLSMAMPVEDVLDAAREAGRQLVATGEMQLETLATVSRDLLPLEMYLQIGNSQFQLALDKLAGKAVAAPA